MNIDQFGFMSGPCNNQMKDTNKDAQLGFMSNVCNDEIKQLTQQDVDDFAQQIKTYVGTEDKIEITTQIKEQLIDAIITKTPLNTVAKQIAHSIITHNKLILKLERCNQPQDRVLTQKDDRIQQGLENTQALRNTHYNAFMKQRMRFRREA